MGFLDIFKGNKASDSDLKNINSLNINYKIDKDPVVAEPDEAAESDDAGKGPEESGSKDKKNEKKRSFSMGIEQMVTIRKGKYLVLLGRLHGKAVAGDKAIISEEHKENGKCVEVEIIAFFDANNNELAVKEAVDCMAGVIIDNVELDEKSLKTIHSENASFREKTIGIKEVLLNKYLKPYKFRIELEVIWDLSLTELIELYDVYISYYKSISEKPFEGNVAEFDLFMSLIQLKLLKEKSVYCVYSKKTGEPFMKTLKRVNIEKGEFECTSPGIILYTKEYKEEAEKSLKNVEEIELREIVNLKEDGNCNNAIEELLIKAVYSNGADIVLFNSSDSVVMSEDIVNRPKELDGEILNPKLVKWMLLIGQMGEIKSHLEMAEYDFYYDMIEKSVIEAKLLMPVQHPEKKPKALVEASKGRSGKVSNRKNYRIGTSKNMGINKEDDSQKGVTIRNDGGNLRVIYRSRIKLSVIKGKKGRKAICLFTDMKRLRDMYSGEWTGMIQPPGKIINAVDLVINLSSYKKGGLYISEEMYKEMENKYLKK